MARSPTITGGLSLTAYYLVTWRVNIVLICSLAAYSGAAQVWVAGTAALLALCALTTSRSWINQARWLKRTAFYGVPLALMIHAGAGFHSKKDLVFALTEILLAALPVLLVERDLYLRTWLALLAGTLAGLAALIVSDQIGSYVLFIAFLCVAVFNLNATKLYFLASGTKEFFERLPTSYFYQLTRALPPAIVVGAVIFFAFPRMRALGFNLGLQNERNQVGFRDSISLAGRGGPLEDTGRVAFWVSSPDVGWLSSVGSTLYFRGATMENFNGGSWAPALRQRRPYHDGTDARILVSTTKNTRELSVFVEPAASRALFYPEVLRRISGPFTLMSQVRIDTAGNLSRSQDDAVRFSYNLWVDEWDLPKESTSLTLASLRRLLKRDLGRVAGPHTLDEDLLAMTTAVAPEIADAPYFLAWRQEVGTNMESKTLPQVLGHLRKHFKSSFKTSLSNTFSGKNALEAFLTTDRIGHCEYFASAGALYLRQLGIPTRVVAGFLGGNYNVVSKTLEVMSSNAHAWLEVYMPGAGWVPFDPTPMQAVLPPLGLAHELSIVANALSYWFNRYVIDYDYQAQTEIVRSLSEVNVAQRLDLSSFSIERNSKELVVIGAVFLTSVWLLIRVLKRRRQRHNVPLFYLKFMHKLAKSGLKRRPHESFKAFHQRAIQHGWEEQVVMKMDKLLELTIYAEVAPPADGVASAHREVQAMRTRAR